MLSSIERRYQFSSVMTGLIASTVGITVALCTIPVSYFGGRGNKPRWLGIGAIIHGVGALVFALPQFVAGPYQPSTPVKGGVEFCSGEATEEECPETSPLWVSGCRLLRGRGVGVRVRVGEALNAPSTCH